MTTRTYTPRQSDIERRWFVVDASGQTLGRVASQVAQLLSGKHKPTFARHVDTGDHVIVVNAARIAVGGDKLTTKVYARHSGYPGGFRQETLGDLLARRPEEVIRRAVKGMLPRNTMGVQQLRKLKVYAGADHPHEAQQPQPMVAGSTTGVAAATLAAATSTAPASTREAPVTTVVSASTDVAEAAVVAEAPVAEAAPEAAFDTAVESRGADETAAADAGATETASTSAADETAAADAEATETASTSAADETAEAEAGESRA